MIGNKTSCVIFNCESRKSGNCHLFKIPNSAVNDENWKQFFDQNNIENNDLTSRHICQLHFKPEMINFENPNRIRLKSSAYPRNDLVENIINKRKCPLNELSPPQDESENLRETVKKILILSDIQVQPPQVVKLQEEIVALDNKLTKVRDEYNTEIFKLKAEILKLADENSKLKKLYNDSQLKFSDYKKLIDKVLSQDQLTYLAGKSVSRWSDETVQKSIIARHLGGDRLLNFSRRHLVPLCAPSTLCGIIQNLKFNPGIIHFNLDVIKKIVENFEPHKRIGDIKIDEKSIIEGQSFDTSSRKWIGNITLPECNSTAKNVLVVLLTLMCIRIKIVVGYHFTGTTTDGTILKDFLYSLIREVENKCGIKINMIGCDMGPTNVSFFNAINLSTCKKSRANCVIHPNDPNRTLKLNLDIVHHIKNLANGLRNHNAHIPKTMVEKYNLSSSVAKLADIKKLFNKQQKMTFKPAANLKFETIFPDHFERMQERTAYNLISDDVSTALQFICSSNLGSMSTGDVIESNFKISPTAWFLSFLNKLVDILLRTKWTLENFDSHKNWLINEAIPILESLTFENSNIKCIPGLVLSIFSTTQFIKDLFKEGVDEINPEWLSNNSIENFFSQVVRLRQKPSALHIVQSIKSLSLTKFMQEPVSNSNYNFSLSNVSTGGAFLRILRENSSKNREESTSWDSNFIEIDVDIPDQISWNHIFKDKLEFNAFIYSIVQIIEKFSENIDCDRCKSKLMWYIDSVSEGNQLLLLKSKQLWEPSQDVQEFFMVMEFIFQVLQHSGRDIKDGSFIQYFTNFILHRVSAGFEHCTVNLIKLIQLFIKYRVHIELKSRHIHRRAKHASKVN